MKITMLDTVETSHTIIPELEKASIKPQAGLRVLAEDKAVAGGLTGLCYVLLIDKGAKVDLPERLANRLVKIGHATRG